MTARARDVFVAYVYPGWHPDPYRPGTDEWTLLDHFHPHFDGHEPPARPLAGFYDDRDPETARRQLDEASAAGVGGMSYFMYFASGEFVMDEPLRVALEVAAQHGPPVATTWCIRLPHRELPLGNGHRRLPDEPPAARPFPDGAAAGVTLGEVARLLDAAELEAVMVYVPHRRQHGSGGAAGRAGRWDDRFHPCAATGAAVPLPQMTRLLEKLATGVDWAELLRARDVQAVTRLLTVGQLEALDDLVARRAPADIPLRELERALELSP